MSGVLARTAGNVVSPAVTAIMQTAAVTTGHIDLAYWATPAGAFAGSLTEEGVTLLSRAWRDRSERVQDFLNAVADQTEVPIDEVPLLASESRSSRRLLGRTVESVVDSESLWRIDTLARIFVTGARDAARVDEMIYLIDLLSGVEAPESRMMAIFCSVRILEGDGQTRTHIRRMSRSIREVSEADPGLANAALPILLKLKRLELLEGNVTSTNGSLSLSATGFYCAQQLHRIGRIPDVQS